MKAEPASSITSYSQYPHASPEKPKTRGVLEPDDLLPVKSYCKFSCPNFFMSRPNCARCKFYNLSDGGNGPSVAMSSDRSEKPPLPEPVREGAFDIMDMIGRPGTSIVSNSPRNEPNVSNNVTAAKVLEKASANHNSNSDEKPTFERNVDHAHQMANVVLTEEQQELIRLILSSRNDAAKKKDESPPSQNGEIHKDTQPGFAQNGGSSYQIVTSEKEAVDTAKVTSIRYTRAEMMKIGESALSRQVPNVSEENKDWFSLVFTGVEGGSSDAAFKVCERPFAVATAPATNQRRVCFNPMFQKALKQSVADKGALKNSDESNVDS